MFFPQKAITLLKGNFIKLIPYFVGIAIPTLLLCATFPTSTDGFIFGKKEKEELEKVKAELRACKAELEKLQKAEAYLKQQLATCNAERDKLASAKNDIFHFVSGM